MRRWLKYQPNIFTYIYISKHTQNSNAIAIENLRSRILIIMQIITQLFTTTRIHTISIVFYEIDEFLRFLNISNIVHRALSYIECQSINNIVHYNLLLHNNHYITNIINIIIFIWHIRLYRACLYYANGGTHYNQFCFFSSSIYCCC